MVNNKRKRLVIDRAKDRSRIGFFERSKEAEGHASMKDVRISKHRKPKDNAGYPKDMTKSVEDMVREIAVEHEKRNFVKKYRKRG